MLTKNMRKIVSIFTFIISLLICVTCQVVIAQGPAVVSTNPANGAINVPRDLSVVSITFDKEMGPGRSITSYNWPYSASWSVDKKTIYLTRTDTQMLQPGIEIKFILNPDPSLPGFRDLEGNPLEIYTFSFEISLDSQVLKIPSNSDKGFHWPYYLGVPNFLTQNKVLLVAPNNTGFVSDNPAEHDAAANGLFKWFIGAMALDLGIPLLVPTFPRPSTYWWIYTHGLDRDSLLTDLEGLQRIDLQLIAMMNDARERLASMGIIIDERSFMLGFSASAQFTNRFTLLHPEQVKAAAIGSTGWLTVPVSVWGNADLRYPVGISDLEMLTGQPFNLQYFRFVPQYSFIGDQDTNDAVDFSDTYDEPDRLLIYELFGDPQYIWERRLAAHRVFESVQSNTAFKIYPGVGHVLTSDMFADVKNFFIRYNTLFPDVPTDLWYHPYVMAIYSEGVTRGCSMDPLQYCPSTPVTREQMASFIVRAVDRGDSPGPCNGVFTDVPIGAPHCANIERLKALNITQGCGPNLYCPLGNVTRQEMASFLVRAVDHQDATVCDGTVFNDVPLGAPHCANIERLKELNVTLGCGAGLYCPANNVLRDQMAAFLARAFLGMQ